MEKKMTTIKKWFCLCSFLLIFSGRGMAAWGAEAIEADIDRAFTQEDKLYVYINHNRGADFLATADNSELFLDGQVYGIENIQTLEEAKVPVSYLFLVDVSGSMDEQRIEMAKSMIHQFLDGKDEQDNFCVVTMGNNLNSSGFSDSPEEIAAWTDQIAVTNEDTNLYYSISEELKVMETERAVRSKRCMVIFSDGADDQAAGITREEAETAVRDAHIPVFSVALLQEEPTEAQMESAKILGSFSRYSAGGKYYAPVVEGNEPEEIYGDIQTILKNSLIVTADLSQIDKKNKDAKLQIKLSDGSQKAEDEVTIFIDTREADREFSGDLAIPQDLPQDEGQEEKSPIPETEKQQVGEVLETETEEEEDTAGGEGLVIGMIAGIFLLLVLIVVVVLLQKKKKCKNEPEMDGAVDEAADAEFEKEDEPEETEPAIQREGAHICMLTLVRMGQGKMKKFDLKIKDNASMGRGRKCMLSLPEDKALSEIHCTFQNRRGKIFLMDENSTNGTFVNGVPIAGEHELFQDDILLIGSYEYRVVWR